MAAPATVDEFLDLVRKSGVADDKRLDACLARLRADMPPDAPKAAGILVHSGVLTNFQAENILAGKWRRFSIGKYKVLERLGSGGFAQVYLCEHKLMRRRVAVKVLPVAKTKDSSALERFHREARAVATLDHPNIVHAYDVDQDEDLHFLVMEYIDGANLQEIVKKSGPLSVLRACHYVQQAAFALQHAHEHELVHRDIKPGNILVDRGGVVKLLDLGLAISFAEEDDQLTKKHDDGTLGTADYLSPEQAMDSHDVDIRTDIYSLGVTFYFMLTGRAPFEGLPIAQKLLAHQMKQAKPVSEFRKDVPAGVQAVLDKMMAKNAAERYATPGDVADALVPFTQTPIGPPTDAEMPRLSPAATGQAVSELETDLGKHDTPVTSARNPPGSGSTKPAAPSAAPPSAGSDKGKSAAAAIEPATVAEPFATDLPTAKAGQAPATRGRKSDVASTSNPIVFGVLVAAFVVIPLAIMLIAGAIWFFYLRKEPAVQPGPRRFEVSRDPNRTGAYRSIQAALIAAEIDSVIELWDDTYEENVVVEKTGNRRSSITIQAAPDKEIVWRSARNDSKEPILVCSTADNFKLNGKGITFDGKLDAKREVRDLIRISYQCPGLNLEGARFRNFERSAILVINATGTEARPIKMHRLVTETADKTRAAIYFDANPSIQAIKVNEHITIEDCDFRGHDNAIQWRPVVKDGPGVFGENVTLNKAPITK